MKKSRIRRLKNNFRIYVFIFLTTFLFACDTNNKTETLDLTDKVSNEMLAKSKQQLTTSNSVEDTLIFGFDLRSSPTEDAKQYLPFINYLSDTTNLQIELKFTAKENDIATELGEGRLHLAAIGATSYIKAHERYGVKILARGVNQNGKAEYRSIVVTQPTSKLKNLKNLKGKRLAFGSIDSTQGHLIPRIELGNHNIYLKDLESFMYTGSHINCANSVISNQMDACGMQDTMAEELVSKNLLRVLYTSPYYPSSGIVANQNIPINVLEKITQVLIAFDPEGVHKNLLYNWDKTEMPKGFIRADPNDYTELRKWMIQFELLTELKSSS